MTGNSRTESVTIMMTEDEKRFFAGKASEQALPLSEYLRRKIYSDIWSDTYVDKKGRSLTKPIGGNQNG